MNGSDAPLLVTGPFPGGGRGRRCAGRDIRTDEITARKRPFVSFGKLLEYQPRIRRMADRADPDIPQESADGAKAEVPQDADTRSTPEISVPTLEVHAPHEALYTWKGFFIHIATIVIGLFIAVALEQSVEALNHGHERAALRADLQTESRQIIADARGS
jgi:hypothetical protein